MSKANLSPVFYGTVVALRVGGQWVGGRRVSSRCIPNQQSPGVGAQLQDAFRIFNAEGKISYTDMHAPRLVSYGDTISIQDLGTGEFLSTAQGCGELVWGPIGIFSLQPVFGQASHQAVSAAMVEDAASIGNRVNAFYLQSATDGTAYNNQGTLQLSLDRADGLQIFRLESTPQPTNIALPLRQPEPYTNPPFPAVTPTPPFRPPFAPLMPIPPIIPMNPPDDGSLYNSYQPNPLTQPVRYLAMNKKDKSICFTSSKNFCMSVFMAVLLAIFMTIIIGTIIASEVAKK